MSRAAGLDLGRVRVGFAVSDELGLLAHPRPHLNAQNVYGLIKHLKSLVASEGIDVFVVGLPVALSGREGSGARRAREFAERLGQATGVRVELLDERLTTVEAKLRLREQGLREREARGRIDSASAAVLLQLWLDQTRQRQARSL